MRPMRTLPLATARKCMRSLYRRDRLFGVAADGTTDDAARFAVMATKIPDGKTLRLAGGGDRIIGTGVIFAQDNLTIVADAGARLVQKSATLGLDFLLKCTGDGGMTRGLSADGNLAGNTGTYTGRGELIIIEGDRWRAADTVIGGLGWPQA